MVSIVGMGRASNLPGLSVIDALGRQRLPGLYEIV